MTRIVLYLGSQRRDTPIDAPPSDEHGIPPDSIEDRAARQRATGTRGEIEQQRPFLGGQVQLDRPANHLVRDEIDFILAKPHRQRGGRTAPEEGARSRINSPVRKGLVT